MLNADEVIWMSDNIPHEQNQIFGIAIKLLSDWNRLLSINGENISVQNYSERSFKHLQTVQRRG